MEEKKYKITYLLGAGASANALPTVNGFDKLNGEKVVGLSESMRDLSNKILEIVKKGDAKSNYNISNQYIEIAQEFSEELKELSEQSNKFGSIDTYAKYLYHTNRKHLNKLKKYLSLYFMYKQCFEMKFDTRYLTFLTSVLNEKGEFPKNIKIVSWNYDSQFQIAANVYEKEGHYKNFLEGYPLSLNSDTQSLSLIQLNGVAGHYIENANKFRYQYGDIKDVNTFFKFIQDLDYNNCVHLLSFAWEKDNSTETILILKDRLEKILRLVEKTNVLVIIGYSFPFFNREIDNQIFIKLKEGFTPYESHNKIYYQDPFNNGEFLKNQFQLADFIEVEHIQKVDNFFLPLEL